MSGHAVDTEAQLRLRQARADLELVEQLRERRDALGLSQHEVARRMGRHQSVVSNLERLGSDPRLSSIRRYANALGVVVEHQISEPQPALGRLRELGSEEDEPFSPRDAAREAAAYARRIS